MNKIIEENIRTQSYNFEVITIAEKQTKAKEENSLTFMRFHRKTEY